MADPSEPITDPLLRPDFAPRDARGAPLRAPLGNSALTLGLIVVLVAIGIGVWWLRRPDDLSTSLGGREWVITDVDGEPALNQAGTVSTFVLDGNGEVRGIVGCNVATGTWTHRPGSDRIAIAWTTQTDLSCPADWPTTYLPDTGEFQLGDGVLEITSNDGDMRAIALADHESVTGEATAGDWVSGGDAVEIGRRGLFQIEACEGDWQGVEVEVANGGVDPGVDPEELLDVRFDEVQIQREGCDLDPLWLDDAPFRAVESDGSIYLHRTRSIFPLDREIVRLDHADDIGVAPLVSP